RVGAHLRAPPRHRVEERGLAAACLADDAEFHVARSEEHTSELQSRENLVCRLLLEKKKMTQLTYVVPFCTIFLIILSYLFFDFILLHLFARVLKHTYIT